MAPSDRVATPQETVTVAWAWEQSPAVDTTVALCLQVGLGWWGIGWGPAFFCFSAHLMEMRGEVSQLGPKRPIIWVALTVFPGIWEGGHCVCLKLCLRDSWGVAQCAGRPCAWLPLTSQGSSAYAGPSCFCSSLWLGVRIFPLFLSASRPG